MKQVQIVGFLTDSVLKLIFLLDLFNAALRK